MLKSEDIDIEKKDKKLTGKEPEPLFSPSIRKQERKIEELKGSRWASLVLLIVTILISLFFYLHGQFARREISADEFFGTQTYRFEK